MTHTLKSIVESVKSQYPNRVKDNEIVTCLNDERLDNEWIITLTIGEK